MRRLVFPAVAAIGLVMAGPSSAFADDPNPTVSVKATAGQPVCKVTDKKLDEMSGIVATRNGFVVINDGTNEESHRKVFFLDTKCKVVDEKAYSGKGPFDPEDLILAPDQKTLWIADIGDNNFDKTSSRPSLALWTMPLDGSKKPVIHRVSYPDGDHHDAEALLLTGNNIPLIITKEIGKPAAIYQPAAALKADNDTGVPLKKVGELSVNATETSGNPYARIGNKTIDGGAISPDGKKVVLRTYTDALEWDVPNGDVLAALKNKPRTTALPDETAGEAITYSPDGKLFYTVSDMNGADDPATSILKYTPATTVAELKKSSGGSGGGSGAAWYADLTLDQITYAVGAVGLLGLLLVGAGVFGITQHRKKAKSSPAWADDDPPEKDDPETELIGVGGASQRAGVYGGARSGPAPAAAGAGVYGNNNAQRSGPIYGAGGGAAAAVSGGGAGRPPQGQPPRGPQGQPGRGPQGQPARGPQGQPARASDGPPARGPQGQPARGSDGAPARGPQGQPARGPQGQPARGSDGAPARGPQGQPGRGPQGQPARGPARGPDGQPARGQGQPGRGTQGQPGRGSDGQPPRGQGQPGRGQQGQPARGPQGQPGRGTQGQPPRGPQGQPARGPQGQPARGPQGQPGRAPQGQPGRGSDGQTPRGPQQQPGGRSGPVYGGGGQQQPPPRGPQGQRPQRPAGGAQGQGGGGGGQGPRPPQGQGRQGQGPRSQGTYGQPGNGQGRPPQRGGDGYTERGFRPEERFDNPGYRR